MVFDHIVAFFMPEEVRGNKTHPKYNELRIVLSTTLVGLPFVIMFPLVLYGLGYPVIGFLINIFLVITIILCVKFFGHYRIPMTTTALVTYFIIYQWIATSGMIYSSNVGILHMYLLAAILADKKYGWFAIFTNLLLFGIIYHQTIIAELSPIVHQNLGGPLYALVMNCLITVFFGGFFAYLQFDQERDREKIRLLQDQKINVLDNVVKERTEQLNNMRESIATDFHDETGNMLSAITRQATLLKLKVGLDTEALAIVSTIIKNSNDLYASSKDFVWHLHNNSDDPVALFDHLTSYGQVFYNQFDIAFSSVKGNCPALQLAPSASLNLLYIFKEAMTNIIKHAEATEVFLEMEYKEEKVIFIIRDNGAWKEADPSISHYGLSNMRKRAVKNAFTMELQKHNTGTVISIQVPIINLG